MAGTYGIWGCYFVCVCVSVCVCVFVSVLGEVSPSLLCFYIQKIEICNLYRLAAGKKDLAHGVFCLDLSLTLIFNGLKIGKVFKSNT